VSTRLDRIQLTYVPFPPSVREKGHYALYGSGDGETPGWILQIPLVDFPGRPPQHIWIEPELGDTVFMTTI